MKRWPAVFVLLLLPFPSSHAVDIPLVCADRQSFELRSTNVIKRCLDSELSLGEGPLLFISLPATRLNPQLEARFMAAQAAARKEGIDLRIISGFRSYSKQQRLFDQAIRKYGSSFEAARWVAPPEVSKHPMGLAIDVNYPNDSVGAGWLEINGYKFGLCRTFENEWWHFEGNIAPGWQCPKMLKDASALLKT